MLPTTETASTPWRHGPFKAQLHQLSFGQTYEDSGIELQALSREAAPSASPARDARLGLLPRLDITSRP
jgi:hypothetical protein